MILTCSFYKKLKLISLGIAIAQSSLVFQSSFMAHLAVVRIDHELNSGLNSGLNGDVVDLMAQWIK